MKNIVKKIFLILLALLLPVGFASCGSEEIENSEFSVTLPRGYKRNIMSDMGDDTYIYTKGLLSSNMITITEWDRDDIESICSAQGNRTPSVEDLKLTLLELYLESFDRDNYETITLEGYTLYEYSDLFDSTAAYYMYVTDDEIWTIDFSIEDDEYEDFKEKIPAVIASFKLK